MFFVQNKKTKLRLHVTMTSCAYRQVVKPINEKFEEKSLLRLLLYA